MKFLSGLTKDAAPIFVPVLFETKEKRDTIRKILISNSIYCPIHWPKPKHIPTGYLVNEIYDTELSLICDQRYSFTEMQKIVEIIQTTI